MKIRVKITKKHIKNGSVRESQACPVALALKDTGRFSFVSVGIPSVMVRTGDGIESYLRGTISEPCRKWIHDFDRNGKVKPATFYITVSNETVT